MNVFWNAGQTLYASVVFGKWVVSVSMMNTQITLAGTATPSLVVYNNDTLTH